MNCRQKSAAKYGHCNWCIRTSHHTCTTIFIVNNHQIDSHFSSHFQGVHKKKFNSKNDSTLLHVYNPQSVHMLVSDLSSNLVMHVYANKLAIYAFKVLIFFLLSEVFGIGLRKVSIHRSAFDCKDVKLRYY